MATTSFDGKIGVGGESLGCAAPDFGGSVFCSSVFGGGDGEFSVVPLLTSVAPCSAGAADFGGSVLLRFMAPPRKNGSLDLWGLLGRSQISIGALRIRIGFP